MMAVPQAEPNAHSLREVADDTLAMARAAQEKLDSNETSTTIHELRVALKRWRALLRLLEDSIGDETVALRHEASSLAREFSRSRDAQTALDALADVVKPRDAKTPPLSERTKATLTQRLEDARKAIEAEHLHPEAIQHLRDSLARASACAANWPLEHIRFDDIVTALAKSYRRTRRRRPREWDTAGPEEVHDFRKAVVAFRYQLDLIAPLWPKMWNTFIDEVQKLRTQLGRSNDLVALRGLIQPKQPLAPWRSRLTPRIDTRQQFHLSRARSLSGRVFAESPRSFRKRIEALAEAAADSP
ncbi:MAG: CHAD domain-containing protein [Candidatus Afipia apatlaquensis]|uniref:CHAD domain-containing protein n=1 Tax=Candidatus Afipia apatlaquensis TaxID=2712852 RepID=A0A7C9RCF3_9BRAD|nr:CHAD domain-containing protein [Candidatus Afipia apatlaquensis]